MVDEDDVKAYKFRLFLFTLLFCLCGVGSVIVGAWLLVHHSNTQPVVGSNSYITVCRIIFISGVIVTVISFLGTFGAVRKNKFMWLLFSLILFLMSIPTLVGGILILVNTKELDEDIYRGMLESIPKYGNDSEITDSWDSIQEKFKCCGLPVNGSAKYIVWQLNNFYLGDNNKTVPDSCCPQKDAESIEDCQLNPKNQTYSKSCHMELTAFMKTQWMNLGVASIVISAALLLGSTLSCGLNNMIEKARNEKEN